MLLDKLKNYRIFLASKSPRRQMLLQSAGINFATTRIETDESFPEELKAEEIPVYLSQKKADAVNIALDDKTIIITADTIVWFNNRVVNKPRDRSEAIRTLKILSGKCHKVYTGVTIKSKNKEVSFFGESKVFFRILKSDEITYYVDTCKPYDKAGAYGIQEWIGYIGIKKVKGSFYNVMGLPISKLYKELDAFIM